MTLPELSTMGLIVTKCMPKRGRRTKTKENTKARRRRSRTARTRRQKKLLIKKTSQRRMSSTVVKKTAAKAVFLCTWCIVQNAEFLPSIVLSGQTILSSARLGCSRTTLLFSLRYTAVKQQPRKLKSILPLRNPKEKKAKRKKRRKRRLGSTRGMTELLKLSSSTEVDTKLSRTYKGWKTTPKTSKALLPSSARSSAAGPLLLRTKYTEKSFQFRVTSKTDCSIS